MKKLFVLVLLALTSSIAFAAAIVTKATPINNVSAGSNYTQTQGTSAAAADIGSYHCKWSSLTGILDGHFDIEVSNDGGVSWVAKYTSPQPAVSPDPDALATIEVTGANGAAPIVLSSGQIVEELYRVKWVKEGVTGGTVSCFVIFKG